MTCLFAQPPDSVRNRDTPSIRARSRTRRARWPGRRYTPK
jgi:hypothetical protein